MTHRSLVWRTLDPALLNAAANHPHVFPHLGFPGGTEAVDLAPLVTNADNVCMVNEAGGFLAQKVGPGIYEIHSMRTPEGRGDTVGAAAGALRYLFTATDALEARTKVPACNPAAAGLARAAGFSEVFTREGAWLKPDGQRCSVSYQTLTLDGWRERDITVELDGTAFHQRLEKAKAEAGSALADHPHDESHDRAVGAAVQMIRAGNAEKAVYTYNSWAAFAGYAPITLLSLHPVIIDLVDAVVEVRNNEMEILQCR